MALPEIFFLRGLHIFLFPAHADRDKKTSRDFGFFADSVCRVVDSPASAIRAFGEARVWDSYVYPIHLQHSVGTWLICLEKTVYFSEANVYFYLIRFEGWVWNNINVFSRALHATVARS